MISKIWDVIIILYSINVLGRDYMWFVFALLSAVFAALTSILAKVGINGVNSNLATAIRTVVVVFMSWGMVFLSFLSTGRDLQASLGLSLGMQTLHHACLLPPDSELQEAAQSLI